MARPSARAFFRNFDDYDAPLEKKVRLAVRNNIRKLTTLSDCCGHPGEPGCWQRADSPREGGHDHPHDHGHSQGDDDPDDHHRRRRRHERSLADDLEELKARVSDLASAVEDLLSHKRSEPPPPEGPGTTGE